MPYLINFTKIRSIHSRKENVAAARRGRKNLAVRFSVGGNKESIVTRKFVYIAHAVQIGEQNISIEDRSERLEQALLKVKKPYGEKLQYTISS